MRADTQARPYKKSLTLTLSQRERGWRAIPFFIPAWFYRLDQTPDPVGARSNVPLP